MRHAHAMPFGAEVCADGRVRFSLWAPAAKRVELVLSDEHERAPRDPLPMQRGDEGFHLLVTGWARPGSRYRFRIDDRIEVPDPAARASPDDAQAASEVVDAAAFDWNDVSWRGRHWHEAVIYELHVGTFTAAGSFQSAIERLPHLAALGVTAIELMPVADFPGKRNWGYDGVQLFAPDASYGAPDDLKSLVQAAHRNGLMIFLDVVYNHFGPEGNYLHAYAPGFFSARHQTLWGQAINFDGEGSRQVRDFFIHNTLYWLEEYRFDGLRYDAVNAIRDESRPHILEEIAAAAHAGPGRDRSIHLVLENDANTAHWLHPADASGFRAQWNDDMHHALHVVATGEFDGYYADYVPHPARYLARCLSDGFAYQGEVSSFRDGRSRGEPSAFLPPTAFVSFLQNHDQVGNRAFGERITELVSAAKVRCLTAILLLAPQPPLLFMGQEFGAASPFQFFCDFHADLAAAVARGRRAEFARFARFASATDRQSIPDPNDVATFERSRLNWAEPVQPVHATWLEYHRELLSIRWREIVPLLPRISGGCAQVEWVAEAAFAVTWSCGGVAQLVIVANLGDEPATAPRSARGRLLHSVSASQAEGELTLGPWSTRCYVRDTT